MARLDPSSYKPILQYHFRVQFIDLDDSDFVTYAKGTSLPSLTMNPIKIEYGNTYMYVKGKTLWNDISMKFYALSEPNTSVIFWNWISKHQDIPSGKDAFKSAYIGDVQLIQLNPDETTTGTWKLVNAFISAVNFGEMDWGSNDVVQPDMTFVYDYATWT